MTVDELIAKLLACDSQDVVLAYVGDGQLVEVAKVSTAVLGTVALELAPTEVPA
jgi:hypothetical protein